MNRTYNDRISEKANRNIEKRKRVVGFQRLFIILSVIFIVSLAILLGNGIKALANSASETYPPQKYYTSLYIEPGDSLWTIAETYSAGSEMTIEEYVDDVIAINRLESTEIHYGSYLIVPYFSSEMK